MSDYYIKTLLMRRALLHREQIPQPLIDLKREHLLLVRELKEKQA